MKHQLLALRKSIQRIPTRWVKIAALVIILAIAVGMRLYQFPHYPNGMNQDESSAAYEAYSLLTTGKDRWGEPWPVYFLGWGSGQNVLLSYLSIPMVALFDLTPFAIRIVPLILALLTLLLLFYTVRKWLGTTVALVALLIVAVSPWHVLLSRWAIESNILPFFFMLGVAVLTYIFHSPKQRPWVIVLSLIPFALALYAYGLAVITIPLFLLGVAVFFRKKWIPQWRWWLGAVAIAVIVAAPFGLFFIKNYVTHQNFGFEQHLPFTVPLLPESRLEQVRGNLTYSTRYVDGNPSNNVYLFIPYLLNDGTVYDNVGDNPPLPSVVLLLSIAGLGFTMWRALRSRLREVSIFLLWFFAVMPLFFIAAVNTVQVNVFFIPLIVLAAIGLIETTRRISWRYAKIGFIALVCSFILVNGLIVFKEYLSPRNDALMATNYRPGLKTAFEEIDTYAKGAPIYVSNEFHLNYVQYLFYTKTPPSEYQASSATYDNPDYKNYYFSLKRVPKGKGYYAIRSDSTTRRCQGEKVLQETEGNIRLVRCDPTE